MKKQLLFNFTHSLFQKMTFRIAAFTVLTLLSVQSSFAQQWPILGNETAVSSIVSNYTTVAVLTESGNDVPYVAVCENSIPKVKKRLSNGTWTQVGADLGTSASYARIYADHGSLYVTYVDGSASSKLAVKKYNSTSGSWEPLGSDSNNLYVSTGSVTNANSKFNTAARSSLAFDSTGIPFIAFGENQYTPTVKKFDGTSWVLVGSGTSIGGTNGLSVSLAIDANDLPWVAYCSMAAPATETTGILALYGCSDATTSGTWTAVTGIPNPISGGSSTTGNTTSIRELNLTCIKGTGITAGTLAIAIFSVANGSKATVITYNKSTQAWTYSATVSSNAAPNLNLISDNSGNLYCTFMDQLSSSTLYYGNSRVRKLAAGQTTVWTELVNPAVYRGIEDQTGNLHLAVSSASNLNPYIVYTKTNSSLFNTPIVRMYNSLAPTITAITPATGPVTGQAFTITGTNFTGATAVSFGGTNIASFTIDSATQISGVIDSGTTLSASVTTPEGIANFMPNTLSYILPKTYFQSTSNIILYPTTTSVGTFTISPALPTNLSISSTTGMITCGNTTAAATASATYTITLTSAYGTATTTITFAIGTSVAPSALVYAPVASGYAKDIAITPMVATITLGTATAATYTVSPSLPAGLALNAVTGEISGTPTTITANTSYNIIATTAYGFTAKAITFATGIAPSAFSYTPAPSASYTVSAAITSLVAVITPGTGTPAYTVSPALPAGLALNTTTGEISGTPTTVTASADYTVKATTIYGFTNNLITFSVDSNLSAVTFEKSAVVIAYPNPTTDAVTVTLPNAAVVEKIAVYNSLGQLVRTEAKNSVSLQNLANGNYYLTIYTSEGNYSKKIIKK